MWKKTVGCYLSSIDSITNKLKTSTSLNQLNIYIITTNITFNHSQLLKQVQLSDRTCLSFGQQQQWEVVAPYQILESAQTTTPQDPRACSGLPGWN